MSARWTRRPPGSTWGDYGDDDRLGRLNELTPARLRAAAAEIRAGYRFCLSLPLDRPGTNLINRYRFPPEHQWADFRGTPWHEFKLRDVSPDATDVINDERVTLFTQYSTQWDSFGHVGALFDADDDGEAEVVYYNGARAPWDVTDAAAFGLQGRGVMIDLRRHLGDERTVVGLETLERVMRADGVVVVPGDMVCFHTGFAAYVLEATPHSDHKTLVQRCAVIDGADPRLQRWIDEQRLAALIADNVAVETSIVGRTGLGGPLLPLHELCLFKLGVMLGELWYLSELADWLQAHARQYFFLTAPPLRLPGAVGSPVTPVATV